MVTGARTPLTVDLSGQRVAITAGANGIGKVMADSFVACGASVFISDIDGAAVAACGHPGMCADAGVAADNEGFIDAAVRLRKWKGNFVTPTVAEQTVNKESAADSRGLHRKACSPRNTPVRRNFHQV